MAKTEVRTCFNCSEHIPPETEHFIIDGDPYCKECVEVREYTACQYFLDGEFMGDSENDDRVDHIQDYDDLYEEEVKRFEVGNVVKHLDAAYSEDFTIVHVSDSGQVYMIQGPMPKYDKPFLVTLDKIFQV